MTFRDKFQPGVAAIKMTVQTPMMRGTNVISFIDIKYGKEVNYLQLNGKNVIFSEIYYQV